MHFWGTPAVDASTFLPAQIELAGQCHGNFSMHNAVAYRRKGLWPESQAEASITLDFEARHSRHMAVTTDHGEQIFLNLPNPEILAGGDGLRLGDGRWVVVRAAAEPVVEVRHHDPRQLLRIAWHLGNRHVPAEIWSPALLRILPDPAVEQVLARAGAQLTKLEAPFHAEQGIHGQRGENGGRNIRGESR
jgi:urease accessory protein